MNELEIERLRAINAASKADIQYYEAKNAELREQIAKLRRVLEEIASMGGYAVILPCVEKARAVLEETKQVQRNLTPEEIEMINAALRSNEDTK